MGKASRGLRVAGYVKPQLCTVMRSRTRLASTQGSRPLCCAVARGAPSRRGKRRHGKEAVQTPACLAHLCHALDVLATQKACPAGHNEWARIPPAVIFYYPTYPALAQGVSFAPPHRSGEHPVAPPARSVVSKSNAGSYLPKVRSCSVLCMSIITRQRIKLQSHTRCKSTRTLQCTLRSHFSEPTSKRLHIPQWFGSGYANCTIVEAAEHPAHICGHSDGTSALCLALCTQSVARCSARHQLHTL